MSSAYVRALDYLRGDRAGDWLWGAGLVTRAFLADPRNLGAISRRGLRPLRARGQVFVKRTRSSLARIRRLFVRAFIVNTSRRRIRRLCDRAFKTSKRQAGQVVERVFRRGKPQVVRNVERIERRQRKLVKSLKALRRDQGIKAEGLERAVLEQVQPLTARIDSVGAAFQQLASDIDRDRHAVRSALNLLRHYHGERADALAADVLKLDARIDAVEPALSKALQPLAAQISQVTAALPGLMGRIEDNRESIQRVTASLERPSLMLNESFDVYGTPPALRPIPGWRFGREVNNEVDPFIRDRKELWDSLKHPVLLRWFADLRVMIWPENESSRTLFLTGTFDPNELMWLSQVLTEGMTFVDVGANMGVYSMFASKLVGGSGTVVAVEPSMRDFQRLAFHITLNDLQNVQPLHVAASDECAQASLQVAWDRNSGHNTFGDFGYPDVERARAETVQTRPLDAVVAEHELERVDFVKIDVEGHELRVLAGAVETLARFRPKILIEVFDNVLRAQGASATLVLAFLEQQGYTLHEFSETTGELVPLSRSVDNGSRNLVALHK